MISACKELRRGKERERNEMGRNSSFNLLVICYQYSPFPPLSLTFPTLSPLLPSFPSPSFLPSSSSSLPSSSSSLSPLFLLQVGDVVRMKKPKHGLYPLIGLHSRGEKVHVCEIVFLKSTAPSCLWQTCSHALIILFH